MGFSCRREPRVGLFHPLVDGVLAFPPSPAPSEEFLCQCCGKAFAVRSQVLGWVQTDLCCSWAHPKREEEET